MLSRETDGDCYTHDWLDYHAMGRELLAIILRTGTRSDNALDLATSPKCSWDFGGAN